MSEPVANRQTGTVTEPVSDNSTEVSAPVPILTCIECNTSFTMGDISDDSWSTGRPWSGYDHFRCLGCQ